MRKLLLESIDNESRKAAITFLRNNFKRCFTLDQQSLTDDEKLKLCQEYVKTVEINYCIPWDAGECNWSKALIMAIVRILKTECNDGTSIPQNTRMKTQLKKLRLPLQCIDRNKSGMAFLKTTSCLKTLTVKTSTNCLHLLCRIMLEHPS